MKAMIFAAGLGTRLRPLTDDRPKALVEVAGKPMLQCVIERLCQAGVDELVINIHHFGDKVMEFVRANDNFGLKIHFSDERQYADKPLETGGGILRARQWLDGDTPFIVHNADILTDMDLRAMRRWHDEHKALATLLVKERATQRYFLVDAEARVRGWTNVATGETRPSNLNRQSPPLRQRAFGGVHVISPTVFPLLERYADRQMAFSIVPFYIDICQIQPVAAYEPQGEYTWFDIGKPETLSLACRHYSSENTKCQSSQNNPT